MFVLKIAEGTREVQRAVHSALLNETAGLLYPFPFNLEIGLVIFGECYGGIGTAKNAPRVSDIGHEVAGFSH
jgi:hypothetical protein